jgi:hypothetical protein
VGRRKLRTGVMQIFQPRCGYYQRKKRKSTCGKRKTLMLIVHIEENKMEEQEEEKETERGRRKIAKQRFQLKRRLISQKSGFT